jgi:hypothetical protein
MGLRLGCEDDAMLVHPTAAELEAGLDHVRAAPGDDGTLDLLVRRPGPDDREVLEWGVLDPDVGLVGDSWLARGSIRTEDGRAHPDMQLNVMASRVVDLVAGGARDRWPLAGDQLFVDLDLSAASVPPWTRLAIGGAVIEVTDQPHRGCGKFARRFGADALRFVNSDVGRALNLRGVCARVVRGGVVRPGDPVRRV